MPAVRTWEAIVVGATTAVLTSVLDYRFWKFGFIHFEGFWLFLALLGFPTLSFGVAVLLVRYVETRLRTAFHPK
jgi:hypothetical protein